MSELTGVCVPICTPFNNNGASLDEKAFEANIDSLLENGIHIIAVNGGTGEFPFLSEAEKRRTAEIAARRIGGRAKLIIQTSAIRTEDAIENTKHAAGLGADAALILPPYFEGPGEDGVTWHYEQIARAVQIPIMIYNIPVYTQFDVTPDVYGRLSRIDGIEYIKDSTASMQRIEHFVARGAKVFNGCDFLNFYSLLAGVPGIFSGSGNVIPAQLVQIYNLVRANRITEAAPLWRHLVPISDLLWTLPFNPVAKAASAMTGRPAGACRLPVQPLTPDQLKLVKQAVAAAAHEAAG